MRSIALVVPLLAASIAGAQELRPGAMVRVQTVDRLYEGKVISASGAGIEMFTRSEDVTIAADQIRSVHVARRSTGRGAVLGAAVGGALGAIVLSVSNRGCSDDCGLVVPIGFLGGAAAGLLVGVIAGSGRRSWHPAMWPPPGQQTLDEDTFRSTASSPPSD